VSTHASGPLSGRAAIVTGGGRGLGKAIATALAVSGAGVVLVDHTLETLTESAESIAAAGASVRQVQGSVGHRTTADRAVAEAVAAYGRVDVLVNCAHTYTAHASMETIPEDDFRTELDSGFLGTVQFMQAAFPHLREEGGSIINFGSHDALRGQPNRATYSAAKEAVRGMSRSAARDWGRYGIRVNVLCPSAITPAVKARVTPEKLAEAVATTALGYIGDPYEDVAPVAIFLASDASRYVTGQTINVDGGRWMF
jgi:NAD(P)-dependent dehydrogenase (short-subunit alcohol dehydrogenase family)